MGIAQGDVFWADLPPPAGSGPGFRRPVVVVQGDVFNRSRIAIIVCVPVTGNLRLARMPGNVVLPAIPAKVLRASQLGGGKAAFTQTDQGIEISVAPAHRDDLDTVVALELDRPANTVTPLPVIEASK